MFIGNLYLIAMLTSRCTEIITEVNDDYIIVDTTVIYKNAVKELSATMMRKISEIELLPPLENKADSFSMYPYVNLIEPSVHIVRAHVKQDSKSSETLALITFMKIDYRRVLMGRALLLYVFKIRMLWYGCYEIGVAQEAAYK